MFGRRDSTPRPPPGCLFPTAENRGGVGPAVLKDRGNSTLMANTTQSMSTIQLEQAFWTAEQRADLAREIEQLIREGLS